MNKTIEMLELLSETIKDGGIPELEKKLANLNNEDILALKQVWSIIDISVDKEFTSRNL